MKRKVVKSKTDYLNLDQDSELQYDPYNLSQIEEELYEKLLQERSKRDIEYEIHMSKIEGNLFLLLHIIRIKK
jgi:hypothetical protein